MTREEIAALREVTASQGIMLESTSERLCEKGGVHYGSPDKHPAVRLETHPAGRRAEGAVHHRHPDRHRRDARGAARGAAGDRATCTTQYGHIQEVIVQNFRAKSDTKLADADEPDLDDLLWTIAQARLILGPDMNIQAPPNLSPGVYQRLVGAGLNDWGGVSPVTPDHVNPEAPWPADRRAGARERRDWARCWSIASPSIRPMSARPSIWLAPEVATQVRRMSDAEGLAREDDWAPGNTEPPPAPQVLLREVDPEIVRIVDRATGGKRLDHPEIMRLFTARDADYRHVTGAADALRQAVSGDVIRYVVNRNINYTNICYFRCRFCAFSKGRTHDDLRGKPYDLALEEVSRRAVEAWERGATEVCLQGGIHPDYTGETYEAICRAIKAGGAGHAHPCLLAARGDAGCGDARPSDRHVPRRPQGGGAGHSAGHGRRDPRRRGARHHLPGQDQHRAMARRAARRPQARPAHDLDHHVRPCRDLARLGAPSPGAARPAGRDRRLHRVRAAALRAHGSADVPPGPGAPRPDLPRGGDHAFDRPPGAASGDHQHPDLVGEDGPGGRRDLPERRRQRSRRHA